MDLLKEIGNDIHESIQLETDFPSKNNDKKLPILNLKVWLEKVNEAIVIMYEHYRKELATKTTSHARAAMSTSQKKTILTQELLRIMRNCHPQLEEQRKTYHVNEFMKRMQYSGYEKTFRFDVFNAATKAYKSAQQKDENGERPLHRPKEWERTRRKKELTEKKKSWYKGNGDESVIFVPCTPRGELKKAYEEEIRKSRFKIKVVEQTGTKVKDIIHKKDPFNQGDATYKTASSAQQEEKETARRTT